ncbi:MULTISPECIES: hypothetical protein [Enterobacteriaceae]|uniref:hypothetical protein n=1 Tax=Enterobacteriaceae TaxID=543 RepID=UPI000A4D72E6|nr:MULTISPECIES: hypothetical protein [Enterobacteriaceae]CAF3156319.1 hypothetical protein AI2981V1_4797 [Escherichia coli]CAH5732238.1 hypothetical protein AI2981V1_4797 [Escherichia coli]
MACFECSSDAMLINQLVPWVTVGILIVSALFFSRLLKRDRRMWTFVVVTLVLMEELALSLWLLLSEVQIFSPHIMDGM